MVGSSYDDRGCIGSPPNSEIVTLSGEVCPVRLYGGAIETNFLAPRWFRPRISAHWVALELNDRTCVIDGCGIIEVIGTSIRAGAAARWASCSNQAQNEYPRDLGQYPF